MNMDIEIPPMRGGSTNSIPCPANTSDPIMKFRGSYETRVLYEHTEKIPRWFYHRNPSNELREVENPCSEGSFGRWFLADFDWFFNLNRFVSGVPMIESSRCFSYVRAQCSSFIWAQNYCIWIDRFCGAWNRSSRPPLMGGISVSMFILLQLVCVVLPVGWAPLQICWVK